MASSSTSLETLVVGVDALCEEVRTWLPAGTTPTIDGIVEEGASGPLTSQLPPWTPSAWPSMYTGVNPGKHGVFGFLRFDGYDWDIVNATDVREHAIWELLSAQGYRSVVVNVPVTDPPAPFDGALIPGYVAPAEPTCHPDGLLDEVRDAIGGYRLYNRQLVEGASRDERIEGYETVTAMRGRAFRYLLEREDPDFGFLQFQQSDTVLHEFPDDPEAPERVYRAIDAEIDRTLAAGDPDTVILVSDHGIGPVDDLEFRPNTFLRDAGYLRTAPGAEKPSWSKLATETLRRQGGEPSTDSEGTLDRPDETGRRLDATGDLERAEDTAPVYGEQQRAAPGDDEPDGPATATTARFTDRVPVTAVLERGIALAAGVGLTSQRIGRALSRLNLEEPVLELVPDDLVRAGAEHVDFPRSRAYMRDRIEMGIRLNLEGREPDGIVPSVSYQRVRSQLIAELQGLRRPDGRPVFDDVLARETIFSGPYLENAPDIVVVPANFEVYLSASVHDDPFGPPREPWAHRLHGIVAIAGQDVPAMDLTGAHLLDVAPTLLSLLGASVSDRMDGNALPVVEETERISFPPYDGTPAATDAPTVAQRLSGLGYLE